MFPRGEPTPPNYRKELDEMWRSIRALEARTTPKKERKRKERQVIFSFPGDLDPANGYSPGYIVRDFEGVITRMDVSAGSWSHGPTTWDIDSSFLYEGNYDAGGGVTLPANEQFASADLNIDVDEYDKIVVFLADNSGTPPWNVSITLTILINDDDED